MSINQRVNLFLCCMLSLILIYAHKFFCTFLAYIGIKLWCFYHETIKRNEY